jgi:O-methyltransferase
MKRLVRFARNALSRSEARKTLALQAFARWLFGDYRLTWPQLDWWHDADFNAYLHRFGELDGLNSYRRWSLWQLLRVTASIDGETAECGVFEGASSWLICAANQQQRPLGRTHHLFDSFEGVSAPSEVDGAHWRRGDLAAGTDRVAKNLSPFLDSVRFHKGWIPNQFAAVSDLTFSFVHIDVDLFQPTRDSIDFFYSRINDGGVFLCDDYRFTTCPGATKAIDDFLADKPEKMIALPAGGGFFIKGTRTDVDFRTLAKPRVA